MLSLDVQRFDLAYLRLGGAELVFPVQSVENLERNPSPDSPARHERSHLIIIERSASHQGYLRSEVGPLEPDSFYGEVFFQSDLP